MTIILHDTGNPINRDERNKINENWSRIIEGLTDLQRQIYILSGGKEIDELLERIDKALEDANNATTEVNSKIDEATNLINQLVDLINESQLIINNGNQLINDGTQLIDTLTSLKSDLEQLKSQIEDIADSEAERIDNENDRIANEDERVINEQNRINAEAQRDAVFNNRIQQINEVLPNILNLEGLSSWESAKQYYKNNIVEFNGSSYIALKDNKGQTPPTLPTKLNEYWMLLAQRGVDGEGSVSSVNGKSPNIDGNVELTAEDIGAIPISEKGVVGGVARLNEDGKVVDANGNEVEGKVKSVNNILPDENGNVELNPSDIGAASNTDLTSLQQTVNEHLADIENRLTAGQSETVVLNRGDNITEAELDSIVKAINFEPQTIVNHAPLFDNGAWEIHSNATVIDSTTLRVTPTGDFQQSKIDPLYLKGDTTYTITYELSGVDKNVYVNIGFYDSTKTAIGYAYSDSNKGTTQLTFKTPSNLSYCKLFVTTETNNGQTYTIKNISIVEGSQPKPFVANVKGTHNPSIINKTNGTYLTLLGTFHEGDEVFVDTDGKLKVRRKWKEVELTGDEDWSIHYNYSDYKAVRCPALKNVVGLGSDFKATGVKFNGLIIRPRGTVAFGTDVIVNTEDYMYVTISNSDSGWGQNYTPTKEEIQAYFKGWRMSTEGGDKKNGAYNGTGNKLWYPFTRLNETYNPSYAVIGTAPTYEPNQNNSGTWQPYRLIYELATPTVETIQTVGNLRLEEGTNELTLTEGIIRREITNPIVYENGYSYTNWTAYPKTLLNYKLNKLIAVYKNGEIDDNWNESDFEGYGKYRLFKRNKIDPTAVYTVDYIPLEPYKITAPIKTLTIEYTSSLGSVVEKLVEESSEQGNRISVIERDMVRKGEGVQIIKPLLYAPFKYVNEYIGFDGYFKNSLGMVYGNLFIKINNEDEIAAHKSVFTLPKGFRPSKTIMTVGMAYTDNTTGYPILIAITSNGSVQLANAYAVGKKTFIISFSFKAEQ
ncbi:hypothetical protein [Ureibacillus sp. FSL W8-0352]|uniref:hypothetical protein n=1 Tax=Ureibacillus sp. FSL W8-0352 TaxID=2954596 RepID=UPI0030FBEC4D